MYCNLLFLFTISISFNFIHCFKPYFDYIVRRYNEENIYNDKQLLKSNADLCKEAGADITIRLKICRRIFKLLRDDSEDENPFRQFLYMNYQAFDDQENPFLPVCQKIYVEVDANTIRDHICMPCYGRQAVDSENNPNLKAIWILYGPENSVIVFTCSDSPFCKLQEWYEENEGLEETSFLEPPEDLNFIRAIPIPKTAETLKLISEFQKDKDYIHNMSYNPNHILQRRKNINFDRLCNMMFRRAKYIDKCQHSKNQRATLQKQIKMKYFTEYEVTVPNQSVITTQSHLDLPIFEENTVIVSGYPCEKYKTKGKYCRTFKIMAGPDENSVILIEPTICNGKPCLIPVELVENVTENYVRYIEKYF